MAASTKYLEGIVDGDDPAVEQDRRKFKPFRAIKRIFRGKKKSKGLSQSTGNVLTPYYDDSPSVANLARSISHESVFAKDGVANGFSENTKIRTVLSVGDVTEVPINRLKVDLATEEVASTTSMGKVRDMDQNVTSDEQSTAEVKSDNIFENMNDLTTDVTRLSNKLAYDKIAVRPKRRPAKNARGARQTHIIPVEETPVAENGIDRDEVTDETQERIVRDTSPGPSATKAIPLGLQIPSVTEESSACDTPKRPLRKSPIGAVPTGFVPSLQDVQAFKKRSKRIEESIEPTASKPTENVAHVVIAKTDTVEKPKKSPKAGKKAQKKSGESTSSVFSWKNKIKSPASPRKSKSSDSSKDETKSKGLFSGLKSKKSSDKDTKSSSTVGSKLFSHGDKKEQTKKKGAGIEATKNKKEIDDSRQNTKKKIAEDNKQNDVTDTKAKVTFTAEVEVSTVVDKPTQEQFSPPLYGRVRSPGGMGLFDEINSEMARKMKSKSLSPVEKEDSVPKFQDVLKSEKDKKEKEQIFAAKLKDVGAISSAVTQSENSPSQTVESKSTSDGVLVSETSPAARNKPVPIARIKNEIASKSESDKHVDKESTPTTLTQGSKTETINLQTATEDVTSSTIVEKTEVGNAKPDIDDPVTKDSLVADESINVEKDISVAISQMDSSENIESENTETESTIKDVLQKDLASRTSTDDTPDRVISTKVDHPDEVSLRNVSENSSGGKKVEDAVIIQTAKESLRTISTSSIEESVTSEVTRTISNSSIEESVTSEVTESAEVTSPVVEIPSEIIALDKVENENAATETVEDQQVNTEKPVRPDSLVENTDLAKSVLLSPSASKTKQPATDFFSQVKLKPVSRNAENRKSASVRVSPGGPTPKPLRSRSWNSKDNAADSNIGEKSDDTPVKVGATTPTQTNPVKKPRLALKPKSPLKSPDKLSFSKSSDEQSPVKSPTKRFSAKYSDNSPVPQSPDKPLLLKSPDKQSPLKFVKSLPIVSPNEPATVKNSVKQPLVKSPIKQPLMKFTQAENNNNNVAVLDAETKSVPGISRSHAKPPSMKSPHRQSSVKSAYQDSENVFKVSKTEVKPVTRRTKTPVESSDKPFDHNSENKDVLAVEAEAKPVPRISRSHVKPSPVKNPDRQPSVKSAHQDTENVVKVVKEEVKSVPNRTKTVVDSPDKQLSARPTDQDPENNNVFKAPEDSKPVLRRSSEKKKRGDQDKDAGSEPSWIKIARRRSKHWEDGAGRPKSSSTPTPTAPGSDSARPQSLSAAPKLRSLSSSKAEVPTPEDTPVSPTRNMQSNRTSCIPAINPNPTSKSSPTAKQTQIPGQGKPSWLAIAMQKQKSWGAKEEMV